jgi:hypothetical protein
MNKSTHLVSEINNSFTMAINGISMPMPFLNATNGEYRIPK